MSLMNKADLVLSNERRKIISKIQFKEREIMKLKAEQREIEARINKDSIKF